MTGAASAEGELSPLARLVAECVRRLEEQGPEAVEALCREHPELAPELRLRLAALEETGLLGHGRIGDYVLLRTLGRGGMGVVHLARDARDGRRVALKALPARLLQSQSAVLRFRREARAVAALRHPGIVPLYEAGESDGVPWFTMEWVDGRTLADVIAALSAMELAAERLDSSHLVAAAGGERGDGRGRAWSETACRLLLDVAEALQFAHEHGVIHRDVKPSNILLGRDGKARLFDFGLARLDDAERVTLSGDFTGTPAYAAPEQVGGAPQDVDGRADVYALGVTMYELLTLVLPPDGASTREPVPPRRLNPTVTRDVETICLTALERSPARRYASAAAFAADLRAVLELRPIAARGPRWTRRLARWSRRHRAAALAAVLGALLLIGTPVGLALANARIREQAQLAVEQQQLADSARLAADAARQVADEQRALAQAAARRAQLRLDFLGDMLASPSPLLDGPDARVRDVLDRAAAAAPHDLAADPIALADTLTTLGLSYYRIAEYEAGEAQLRAAIALCRSRDDGALDDTLSHALGGLTALLTDTGRLDDARAAGEEALAISRRLHGERSARVADGTSALGIVAVRSGDRRRAEGLFREALALQTELLGKDDPITIGSMLHVAATLGDTSVEEAEALMRAGVEALRPHFAAGREGQRLAAALRNLAILLVESGRLDEAVTTQREALEVTLKACGAEHPDAAESQVTLAMMLEMQSDPAGAVELLRAAVPILRRLSPGSDEKLCLALLRLGTLLGGYSKFDEAETVLRESVEVSRRVQGPLGEKTVDSISVLGAVLTAQGRQAEATALIEELAATAREAGPAGEAVLTRCQEALATLAGR